MIPKPGSFKKINKIDEILVRNIKEKKMQITNIRNKRGNFTWILRHLKGY